jgi:hypothetical protein
VLACPSTCGAAQAHAGQPKPTYGTETPCMAAGLLYTTMPRAEIVGMAEFDDKVNGLHATITFGRVERSCSEVLNRPDAFSGTLYEDVSPTVAAAFQQPSSVSGGGMHMPVATEAALYSCDGISALPQPAPTVPIASSWGIRIYRRLALFPGFLVTFLFISTAPSMPAFLWWAATVEADNSGRIVVGAVNHATKEPNCAAGQVGACSEGCVA